MLQEGDIDTDATNRYVLYDRRLFFRVMMEDSTTLLLCAVYFSPRQVPYPLNYLMEHLGGLLTQHNCGHVHEVGSFPDRLVLPPSRKNVRHNHPPHH